MKSFVPKRAIHQYVTFLHSSTNILRVHIHQMRYNISHLSEIIFLPAKNRIEIILFFSKMHYIHFNNYHQT